MTDLEHAWDDLPTGPAPVDAILREARRDAARKRRTPEQRLRRSLGGAAVVGGIAAAFVAGSLVSSPAPEPDGPGAALPPGSGAVGDDVATPVAFFGELEAPESCADLLAHYVEQGVDLVGPFGWQQPYLSRMALAFDAGNRVMTGALPQASMPTSARAPRELSAKTGRVTSSETGTNVQEVGVDEPDSVKTDGELLVRLRDAILTTYDVSGDEVEPLGDLDLGDFSDGEILLAGDTVVAVGNDGTRRNGGYGYGYDSTSPQTRVLSIDVTDPGEPRLLRTVDYDSALVTARQHGDDVRLVVSAGLPDLDFVRPGRSGRKGGGQETALRANRAIVEETAVGDWLPTVRIDGGDPQQLLECDQVAVPRADVGLGTMAVVGFSAGADVAGVDDLDAFGLAGDASLAYESNDHLYLAGGDGGVGGGFNGCGFTDFCVFPRVAGGGGGTTYVYDFALDGTTATYFGAGEVEGTIRDRWAMDEYDGVLRLAVGPSSETGNFNSVVTMRAEDDALVEIGRVDRLGVGEDIKSVRWFDGLAILVTFRQVDPLYTIDLTDQDDPELIGTLKIPGFSSYLHPLGSMRMVGLGEGPQAGGRRWGAQAGLFDVTDLTDPRRIDVLSYGAGSRATAGGDPRQFTWLPAERTMLTVIQKGRSGFVSAIEVGGGELANTMTQVEFGSDVDEVRTVPLYGAGPGGSDKVVLVTGEDVAFFDVP
ncbi:MAG: beta-propeller domain-containing protein [Nocardioides sp.]|uniref:beta-propeller domain-containing protein n=1 Tax=Nocardioides sp. TaxID=35761 RepID=UPI00238938A4|nr:beta-propeller domain-containing protein [Nocardioides sp.]MDE0775944.1 beta-propeller domain-containing protein [Nocardioides sp.]